MVLNGNIFLVQKVFEGAFEQGVRGPWFMLQILLIPVQMCPHVVQSEEDGTFISPGVKDTPTPRFCGCLSTSGPANLLLGRGLLNIVVRGGVPTGVFVLQRRMGHHVSWGGLVFMPLESRNSIPPWKE